MSAGPFVLASHVFNVLANCWPIVVLDGDMLAAKFEPVMHRTKLLVCDIITCVFWLSLGMTWIERKNMESQRAVDVEKRWERKGSG